MIDKILIFCLFLGPLIFFHELGHFLFARLFGVKVEVFSIGFGPKLLSFKRGDTQYSLSLIPLGGYVKMFGEDPLKASELTEEEKKVAFTSKSKWARFWIVFGGPLANFLFAFVIYFFLLLAGETVPEPKIGLVEPNHIFYKSGVRTGDILTSVDDVEIASFDDLNSIPDPIHAITVFRNNNEVKINLDQISKENFIRNIMRLGAIFRAPILVNANGEKFILSTNQDKVNLVHSLEEILFDQSENNNLYLHDYKTLEPKIEQNFKIIDSTSIKVLARDINSINKLEGIVNQGYYPIDLMVKSIVMSSPSEKIGLKQGDILTSLNGEKIYGFDELRSKLQQLIKVNKDEKLPDLSNTKVGLIKEGKFIEAIITPDIKENEGYKVVTIGVYSSVEYIEPKMITTPSKGFFNSITGAIGRTINGAKGVAQTFKKLILAEVSMDNLGGPLAIGKVASDSFYMGISMFMRLMAIISINLGLINLFPIPVLDGGHIVFLILEVFNRGPLSKKKILIAQQVGLSLLFALIFIALYNDVSRFIMN